MYLGIDIGTSSVKAVVVDAAQQIIATATAHRSTEARLDNNRNLEARIMALPTSGLASRRSRSRSAGLR